MLKISIHFLPFLFSLGISDDSIFAFDGTFQKGLEFYAFPTSIKLDWFNFLDSEGPLIRCGGKSVISELGIFGVEMEITMYEFDRRYFRNKFCFAILRQALPPFLSKISSKVSILSMSL